MGSLPNGFSMADKNGGDPHHLLNPIGSMGLVLYLPTFGCFFMVNVGKYMGMGLSSK